MVIEMSHNYRYIGISRLTDWFTIVHGLNHAHQPLVFLDVTGNTEQIQNIPRLIGLSVPSAEPSQHGDRHAQIQEFSSGGVGPGQSDKKSSDNVFFFLFLVLSLFYRSQMVKFKEIYHFSRFQRGPTFSRGGPTFSRGGPIAYSL